MTQRISDDDARRAAALYAEHKSERKAAAASGISKTAFRNRLRAAAKAGFLGFKPVLPGFEIKQTSTERNAAGEVQSEWIQQRPESGEVFAVPDGHRVRGVSALLDQDDRIRIKWVKISDGLSDRRSASRAFVMGARDGGKLRSGDQRQAPARRGARAYRRFAAEPAGGHSQSRRLDA